MFGLQFWELLSYVVTVVGLPLAIFTFWKEQRKESALRSSAWSRLRQQFCLFFDGHRVFEPELYEIATLM